MIYDVALRKHILSGGLRMHRLLIAEMALRCGEDETDIDIDLDLDLEHDAMDVISL